MVLGNRDNGVAEEDSATEDATIGLFSAAFSVAGVFSKHYDSTVEAEK